MNRSQLANYHKWICKFFEWLFDSVLKLWAFQWPLRNFVWNINIHYSTLLSAERLLAPLRFKSNHFPVLFSIFSNANRIERQNQPFGKDSTQYLSKFECLIRALSEQSAHQQAAFYPFIIFHSSAWSLFAHCSSLGSVNLRPLDRYASALLAITNRYKPRAPEQLSGSMATTILVCIYWMSLTTRAHRG